jgi:hypothetical protein
MAHHARLHFFDETGTETLKSLRDQMQTGCPGLLLPAKIDTHSASTQHQESVAALIKKRSMFDDNAQQHAKRVTDLFLAFIKQLCKCNEMNCYINNPTINNLFLVDNTLQVSDFGLSDGIMCFTESIRNQWLGVLQSFVQFLFLTVDCDGVLDHHARQWDQQEAFRCYIYPLFINVISSPIGLLGSQMIRNFDAFRVSQES